MVPRYQGMNKILRSAFVLQVIFETVLFAAGCGGGDKKLL